MSNTAESTTQETHNGSCHCGAAKFSVSLNKSLYDQDVTNCNCSICHRNGYLLIYPMERDVTWHSGRDALVNYEFGPCRIIHSFCPVCGTSICAKSIDPNYADYLSINVRTLAGVEVERLKLKFYDGKSL